MSTKQRLQEMASLKTDSINENIRIDIQAPWLIEDWGISYQEWGQSVADDLSLKNGSVKFNERVFEVRGTTESGEDFFVKQVGEFDMYGGPYTPKMNSPKISYGGKGGYHGDSLKKPILQAYREYGWEGAPDLTRTDIWGHVVK